MPIEKNPPVCAPISCFGSDPVLPYTFSNPPIAFFLDPDHISIGSRRDTNIGAKNFISTQRPNLLKRAFQGKVGFVPSIESDVHPGQPSKSNKAKKRPTMFFIGPIKGANGQVLAVMTLRVDPWENFSRVMKSFGHVRSGETYAFNNNGCLLTSSRFELARNLKYCIDFVAVYRHG